MGEAGAIGSFQLGRRCGSDFINWEGERVPQREDRGFFLGGGGRIMGSKATCVRPGFSVVTASWGNRETTCLALFLIWPCVQARRCSETPEARQDFLNPAFPCRDVPFDITSWLINYPLAHWYHNTGEGPSRCTEICLSSLKPELRSLHTFYGLLPPPRPCR